jgi:hypothetical protein
LKFTNLNLYIVFVFELLLNPQVYFDTLTCVRVGDFL